MRGAHQPQHRAGLERAARKEQEDRAQQQPGDYERAADPHRDSTSGAGMALVRGSAEASVACSTIVTIR